MCGLCGEVRFDGKIPAVDAVARMNDVQAPRGPDGAGMFQAGNIALGHRRLKVIDLNEASAQPMIDSELGLAIAFNGCIYNYRALRAELEAAGYRFFSHGDTEVVLKAWHAFGADCVTRFHGMFAFVVWERESGRSHFVRDRLGIKPLYLARLGGALRFASTLPALLAAGGIDTSIDPVALHHYMTFHAVVPAPRTMLAGVRKLPPATVRTVDPDGRERDHCFWRLEYGTPDARAGFGFDDWTDETLNALRVAVERRLEADVPVGVLLSGGLDSSLLVGLLAELGQEDVNTFSVGFDSVGDEAGDEFRYSDVIARHFGTTHHQIRVGSERLLPALEHCVSAMSEPMVSHDVIGFYLLSEEVSRHVKVVQSGQGADEVFGGYHWYPPLVDSDSPAADYARVFFDRDHGEYLRAVDDRFAGEDYSDAFVRGYFSDCRAARAVDKALHIDTRVMLVDDPVKRVDNMTMAWGLEARVPFLDHELVELAAQIPAEHKLADDGKGVLKAAGRRVIPAEVIDRPKGYFPVPALKHIEGPYLDLVRDLLKAPAARRRRLFNPRYVDEVLADPSRHITPLGGSKLWQMALLEYWLQVHHISP